MQTRTIAITHAPQTAVTAASGHASGAEPSPAPAGVSAPAPTATPVPAVGSSASAVARSKVTDYTRFERLELSDDEDGSRRDPPVDLGGGAERIWSELMSGEKKLLTKDGVVSVGAPAVAAVNVPGEIKRYGDVD